LRIFSSPIRFLMCLLLALSLPASAGLLPETQAPEAAKPAVLPDPLKRETPRSMISGLIASLAEHDYDRAAQYFDSPMNSNRQRVNAAVQARSFQALLDNGGSLEPYAAVSNEPTGRIDDDLAIDEERVGQITIQGKKVPVLLSRGEEEGRQIWRISPATVNLIAEASKRAPAAQEMDQESLVVGGAPLKDWGMLVGLGVMLFGGLWIVAALLVALMRRLVADPVANGLFRFFEAALPPLSLLIAGFVFFHWAERIPVAIVARQTLLRYTGIVSVIAFVWFGLRLVDALSQLAIARMQRHQRRQVVSVITLLRRTFKILLLLFSGIGILDTFGIDVTTGIAALGIGGIALALGAQKTVENLVGSVTVIADRPAQVGDFIKVGDLIGTVEDIGIRSTRIRTLERTLVTIPNGDLSARQIENFAARDRYLFNPVIAVDYQVSSAKLREAIGIVYGVLVEHEHIAEGCRARLGRIAERSFNIEVFAYIDVLDFDASVVIREELLLTMYERLEEAGIGLAFQAQTVVFSQEQLGVLTRDRAVLRERAERAANASRIGS
jgi:MscS family membrane protein